MQIRIHTMRFLHSKTQGYYVHALVLLSEAMF